MNKNRMFALIMSAVTVLAMGCGKSGTTKNYVPDGTGSSWTMDGNMALKERINAMEGIQSSDIYVYDDYIAVRLTTDGGEPETGFRDRVEEIIREQYPYVDKVDIIY